jgi:hypothetical protein
MINMKKTTGWFSLLALSISLVCHLAAEQAAAYLRRQFA